MIAQYLGPRHAWAAAAFVLAVAHRQGAMADGRFLVLATAAIAFSLGHAAASRRAGGASR